MMTMTNAVATRPAQPFPLAHIVLGEGADLEQYQDRALAAHEVAMAPTPEGQPDDENLVADLKEAMAELVQATLAVGVLEGREEELRKGLSECLDSRLAAWLPEADAAVKPALVESWLNHKLKQFAETSLPEWRECLANGGYDRLVAGLRPIKGDSRDCWGGPTERWVQRMTVVSAVWLCLTQNA